MSLKYHYNLIYNDLETTLNTFKWDSIQSKMAFKTALSCATAIFIANWLRLDNPFWSGITTLVIMRPNVGAIFLKGWMRAAGCCIGCMLCFFILGFVIQVPLFFSIFLFIGICIAFYTGVQAKYDYFWAYMMSNMALMAMIMMSNPYNNFPIHIAFYRSAEISLGVIVSWFYNIILWPHYAGDELEKDVSYLLKNSIRYIREILVQYSTGEFDKNKVQNIYFKDLHSKFTACNSLLVSSENEKKLLNIDQTKYKSLLNKLEYRVDHLFLTYKTFYDFGISQLALQFKDHIELIIKQFDTVLRLKTVNSKKYLRHFLKLKALLKDIETKIETDYRTLNFKNYNVNEVLVFYEFLYAVNSFTKEILLIADEQTAQKEENKLKDHELKKFDSEYIIFKFKSKILPLYIPAMKNSVKGALAILFTFWLALWLNIPGGYSNMAVAIIAVFSPQMDNMSTKHKGVMRFIGCLSGAALGLLCLTFNIESVFFLIVLIFLVIFFCCIIYAGKSGCSYIGLQAGLAFIICIAGGGFAPSITMDSVIERMTGIFLAISMMSFFNYIMFPDNLILKLKNKILDLKAGLFNYLQSDYIFSTDKKMAGEYTKALTILNIKAESLVKVIEVQQDLPLEEIAKIKNWTQNIQKIANKLTVLDSFDKEILDFIKNNIPKLLKHIPFTIKAAINSTITGKNTTRIQELIEKENETIYNEMVNLRQTGIFRYKTAKEKAQLAVLIILLKHMLNDLKNLSENHINFELLSMQ